MKKREQIELLRAEHATAINNFDFDRAEIINKQISRLQNELKRERTADVFGDHAVDLDEQRELILRDSAKAAADLMEKRSEIINRYHERYLAMQDRHTEELQQLSQDYVMTLEKESTRTIPEVQKLQEQSKIKGKQHNYGEAKRLFQESLDLKSQIVEQRKKACNDNFEARKKQLIQKQDQEIKLLIAKRDAELQSNDEKKQDKENVLHNRMKIKEQRAKQQATPRAVLMRTVSPAVKKRRAQSVTRSQRGDSTFSSVRSSRAGSRLSNF